MTQFKVGDRVKLVKADGSVPDVDGYKVGDTASVVESSDQLRILIRMDNGPEKHRELFVGNHEIEPASPITPPATIQHEGYNYTRGEPVVPEWVKDGAWVVDTVHDRVLQIRSHGCDGYSLYDQKGNIAALDPNVGSRELFRPFTNEDWKWGMWAEYQGEKVFVHDTGLTGIFASRPESGYFPAPFSEITPTTAP